MFDVRLDDNAQWDFDEIVAHYGRISEDLAEKFINTFDETVLKLGNFAFYQIRYGNIRLRQLKNFPVLLHFIVMRNCR